MVADVRDLGWRGGPAGVPNMVFLLFTNPLAAQGLSTTWSKIEPGTQPCHCAGLGVGSIRDPDRPHGLS